MDARIALTAGMIGGVLAIAGIAAALAASTGGGTEGAAPVSTAAPTARDDADDETGDHETTGAEATPVERDGTAPYDTTSALLYLVEEEKLAHDVYATLADQWGTQVFSNIAASEVAHQSLVAPLLEERDLADPRSPEVGVFTDPALQALYDDLVARGSLSLDDAIQVGITIEETDIADLGAAIASEDEADVVSVLERLLAGSRNHLEAFERRS